MQESLTQFVYKPTRYSTFSTAANVLDLVLSNDDFAVIDLTVQPPFGSSDHCSVQFKFVYDSCPHSAPFSRADFRRADWNSMKNELSCVDWSELLPLLCHNKLIDFIMYCTVQ